MTHFLILLFVFVTLFVVAAGRLFTGDKGGLIITLLWAALGTFVFHTLIS